MSNDFDFNSSNPLPATLSRPETELVEVCSVPSPDTAQICSATLNSAGIPCWFSSDSLAGDSMIALLVRAKDVQRAWTVFETFNQCS